MASDSILGRPAGISSAARHRKPQTHSAYFNERRTRTEADTGPGWASNVNRNRWQSLKSSVPHFDPPGISGIKGISFNHGATTYSVDIYRTAE